MIYHSTIQEHVRKLEGAPSHEELMFHILETYMLLFPVRNSYLFRYSPLGYLAEGIISLSPTGLVHIREIRDDLRALPAVLTAIREKKAVYYSGVDYLKLISSRYIIGPQVTSVVTVPISYHSIVFGYILSNEFAEGTIIDEELLSSLTLYGNLVGKAICLSNTLDKSEQLSKRELEAMQRVSWGEGNKEIADSLNLSELTIKQYVKSAMKKLGAQNRSQAVAELFRRGILS